jgi:hypothetical protein
MARVFVSYAHEDRAMREELQKHLSLLQRDGSVEVWHDGELRAGEDWDRGTRAALDAAEIVLLLVSADFLASDYCFGVEMRRSIERHQRDEVTVVPVILRACEWKRAPFAQLLALPEDGRPITKWPDRDEAYLSVAVGLRQVVATLRKRAAPQHTPALAADDLGVSGRVTNAGTKEPIEGVCITIGPPIRCAVTTDQDGRFAVSLKGAPVGLQWDIRFLMGGRIVAERLATVISRHVALDVELDVVGR